VIPRLRMFAGPNGSGKSTLKFYLPSELLGVYLNADELEQEMKRSGFLDLAAYQVAATAEEVLSFITTSPFLSSAGLADSAKRVMFEKSRLVFSEVSVDSYLASVVGDFIRQKLLQARVSFTFETVMSHKSKVELLAQALSVGYRTYLYFVATEDPSINISRVRSRTKLGGHPVPEDKIEPRYYRSLDLLLPAIRLTNRAYIFDNSGEGKDHTWVAEITDGNSVQIKSELVPAWFKRAVLDKIGAQT
jgi:predicted ABC-type ATPase